MTPPSPPKGLGPVSRRFWRDILAAYELRPDEVRILTDACHEIDVIERIQADLRDSPLMVKGSMGQLVASPLVSEVRQHRAVLAGLLARLRLPDADEHAAALRSTQARKAGHARWNNNRGA